MINENLNKYINEAKKQNIPDSEIKNNLIKSGWNESDINLAFNPTQLIVPTPPNTVSTSGSPNMWDAFQHIIMFISLYSSATSLGILLRYFIDFKWFVQNGHHSFSLFDPDSIIISCFSTLIVSSPIFVILFLEIRRKTILNPALRNLKLRKKLIYLTLVITFIIIITRLTHLIYTFLAGDTTINFYLKFLVIISISGTIFFYYLDQVKQDRKTQTTSIT